MCSFNQATRPGTQRLPRTYSSAEANTSKRPPELKIKDTRMCAGHRIEKQHFRWATACAESNDSVLETKRNVWAERDHKKSHTLTPRLDIENSEQREICRFAEDCAGNYWQEWSKLSLLLHFSHCDDDPSIHDNSDFHFYPVSNGFYIKRSKENIILILQMRQLRHLATRGFAKGHRQWVTERRQTWIILASSLVLFLKQNLTSYLY